MEKELVERAEWAKGVEAEQQRTLENYAALESESENRLRQLQDSIQKIDELEARVVERTEWAQRVQAELDQMAVTKVFRLARKMGLAKKPD